MFKQFIHHLDGGDRYLIGSLLTFLVFFVLVGLYLLVVNQQHLRAMSQLPLDDDSAPDSPSQS